jgi:hypothetical protein
VYLTAVGISHGASDLQVTQEWPGLPIGVKFDPSDAQLLEHLEAKCAVGNSKPHMFIDEFIPTLDGDKGICYTHPAKLPGQWLSSMIFILVFPECTMSVYQAL